MHTDGLTTAVSVVFRPRQAFARLRERPTWGWAAMLGVALTLGSVLLGERAQLHVLAVTEAHRLAALSPADRVRERLAVAQVAHLQPYLFAGGALCAPWVIWFLVSVFFFIAARLVRPQSSFTAVWVVVVNAYIIYGLGTLANAAVLAMRDPSTFNSPLDLVGLPTPQVLAQGNAAVSAFLSAYHPFNLWYFVVLALGMRAALGLPVIAASVAVTIYGLLFGLFSMWSIGGTP